jgi:hypothetical protein
MKQRMQNGYYQYQTVPGNTTQLRIFKLACAGYGGVFWSAVVNGKDALGTSYPSPESVDSSASLSRCTLLRHSSFVRAVCVDALVRICVGGNQRWLSLPRQ